MRRHILVSIALFAVSSSLYYSVTAGVVDPQEGSIYALVKSIVNTQSFQIDRYLEYTMGVDYSYKDGHYYSDKAPGTAILGSVFFEAGKILPPPIARFRSRQNPNNEALAYLFMLPALAAAGSVVMLYLILLRYELSPFSSITTSLAFAFGTTTFKYGSRLYPHSLSAFLVLASLWLSLRMVRQEQVPWRSGLLLGFLLGFAMIVEYINAIFVLALLLYITSGAS